MSKLAKLIAAAPEPPADPGKRRDNVCFPVYGEGDLEDWEAVEALRQGRPWRQVQQHVDKLAGTEKPLTLDQFRYHWRRICNCWPSDLRR